MNDHSSPIKASELMRVGVQRLEAVGLTAEQARVTSRVLLQDALRLTREELLIRPERTVTDDEAARYDALLARRERREPLAYILGWREFFGLPFSITPAVLVPRQETEHLVEVVLEAVRDTPAPRIADLGTGSGIIAVAVAANQPGAQVFATDISSDALALARENAERNRVADRVAFFEGDLLAPIAGNAPFDAIASNPPYIAPEEIEQLQPEVRDWEPRVALGTNPDSLHFYRRLAAEAPPLLVPGGLLAVEVGMGQAQAVADLWRSAGLTDVTATRDYAGIERVVTGRRPQR